MTTRRSLPRDLGETRVSPRFSAGQRSPNAGGVSRSDSPPLPRRERMKAPTEVVVEGKKLVLSNLEKVLYPKAGFSKGQVIQYYLSLIHISEPHETPEH